MTLRTHLQRLSSDTIAYGLGAALQKFVTFLLFPLYARLLSPAAFGEQDLVMTVVVMTSLLLVLGMDSGTVVIYYGADAQEQADIRSTWVWSQVLLSVPVCVVLYSTSGAVCGALFGRPELAPYLQLGVLSIPFNQVGRALAFVLRLTFRRRAFVVLTTAAVLFQVVAAIVLVVVMKRGVRGVFEAMVIASILQLALGAVLVRDAFRPVLSGRWLAAMLRVGVPLVPAALSVWVLNYANRYFLARYATLEDIGILSVALRISSILLFAVSAFETAWGPFAYSLAQDQQAARQTYSRVLTIFLAVVLPATAMLSIFAREVTDALATSRYEAGASLVPLYCFSSICWVLLYIVGMGTGIAKKTYHTTIATVLAAFANTLLNWLWIPVLGIVGAALATLGANIVGLIYMYVLGQRYFHVQYDARRVAALVIVAVLPIAAGVLIDRQFVTWRPEVLWVKLPAAGVTLVASVFIVGLRDVQSAIRASLVFVRR